jgi:hypothetical protein
LAHHHQSFQLTICRYELEDHYDWHDDMVYRQKVDKLPAECPVAEDQDEDEEIVSADVIDLGNGIRKAPFPNLVGKKGGCARLSSLAYGTNRCSPGPAKRRDTSRYQLD